MTTRRVYIPRYGLWGTVLHQDANYATVQVDGYASTKAIKLSELSVASPPEPTRVTA